VTEQAIENWKHQRGYDLPLLWNDKAQGGEKITATVFYRKSVGLFMFRFGMSDSDNRNIGADIKQRMWPSLAVALPTLLVGLSVNISFALMMVLFRNTYLEFGGIVLCVILMSVSSLFYIIGGQFFIAKLLRLAPISGYDGGLEAFKFLLFFSIPGLGSYTIDAINSQDFAIVRAMVFLGSVLYVIGLLLTDISYTLVDPRVRLS